MYQKFSMLENLRSLQDLKMRWQCSLVRQQIFMNPKHVSSGSFPTLGDSFLVSPDDGNVGCMGELHCMLRKRCQL